MPKLTNRQISNSLVGLWERVSQESNAWLNEEELNRVMETIMAHASAIRIGRARRRMQWALTFAAFAVMSTGLYFAVTKPSAPTLNVPTIATEAPKPPSVIPKQSVRSDTSKQETALHPRALGMVQLTAPKPFPYHYICKESEVRRMLADIQLGEAHNVDSFYRFVLGPKNAAASEALSRWSHGIRVVNIDLFERKIVPGVGYLVTLKGRTVHAPGMDFELSSDSLEAEVRLKLAEIQMSGDSEQFRSLTHDAGIISREARARWTRGIRVTNPPGDLERIKVGSQWTLQSSAHNGQVPGLLVQLSCD